MTGQNVNQANRSAKFEDFARQYTEFLIKLSKDAKLREEIVDNQDQVKLKEELKATGIAMPETAFVILDENSMYARAYMINKDDSGAVAVIEQSLQVKVTPLQKQGITHKIVDPKDGVSEIMIAVPKAAKEYSILVLLPFYLVTSLEVSFDDGAEIVLSSC